jgi:hypothetical protein
MPNHSEFAAAAVPETLEPRLLRAVAEIKRYSDVDLSVIQKAKTLIKFGHSDDIDNTGYKTVWEGTTINDEPPLFGDPSVGNVIDTIVSANNGDNQTVVIEGHTKSGDDLTFTIQTATLNGQTEVPLTTPLHTCTRAHNSAATTLTGPIYIFDNTDGSVAGVPSDPTDVALYLAGSGDTRGQQSGNAFTAVSSADYWLVTKLVVDVKRSGNGNYDVQFQRRSTTGVWRPFEIDIAVNTGATSFVYVDLNPCIVISSNTYVRALARSNSATDSEVSAEIGGYLASIV